MPRTKLSEQIKEHANGDQGPVKRKRQVSGSISTGSTLLDLAISGGVISGGGLPGGILVEIFGPSSCGKTVLLTEIAGDVQRKGGDVMFYDPEARLNKQFARQFGLNIDTMTYSIPDTVPELFAPIRQWEPTSAKVVNGIFADSLAALSTAMEMEDSDKYGMRRAKEFSEELRKTCRVITSNNFLMVCSNQIRENVNAGPYEQKFRSPGGVSVGFYASVRLRCSSPQKIKVSKLVNGKDISRIVGVETNVDVYKNSIWKPYHSATVPIVYDYGIDDIRSNLQFLKDVTKAKAYTLEGATLSNSLEKACKMIEIDNNEETLRQQVINVWMEIESKFSSERKPKR